MKDRIFFKKFGKDGVGGSEGFWFSIILISIFLVVMFGFLDHFHKSFDGKAYDEVCRQYLKMHMLGKHAYIDPKLDDFPCKTEYQTINSNSKIEIMKQVSKNMVECYNTFNRGQGDIFSANSSNTWNTFCAPCYIVDFSSKNIQISSKEIFAFHTSKYNYKESYTDIFTNDNFDASYNKNTDMFESRVTKIPSFSIDTNKKYMVLFKYQKLEKNNVNNNIPEYFEKVVGGSAIGAVTGVAVVSAAVVAGVATIATAGAATVVLVPTLAAVGGYIGYLNIHSEDVYKDDKLHNYYAASGIYFEEFSEEKLKEQKCDFMVGIQEPGINHK